MHEKSSPCQAAVRVEFYQDVFSGCKNCLSSLDTTVLAKQQIFFIRNLQVISSAKKSKMLLVSVI